MPEVKKDIFAVPVEPRAKGKGYERHVADLLGAWAGIKFRRTPMSGAWGRQVVLCDVVPEDPSIYVPFYTEAKNRESWDFTQAFKDPDVWAPILWLRDEERKLVEKKAFDRPVLLFLSKKYCPDFVMMRECVYHNLFNHDFIDDLLNNYCLLTLSTPDGNFIAFLTDMLFRYVPYDEVKEIRWAKQNLVYYGSLIQPDASGLDNPSPQEKSASAS